ncbi:MAG: peptidyl-prolyl cis-trans isomerase [Sedimentisphaerales bacterium]|nr:peptidyl-prolyl cis-trans isomerase [Sedimentisphaerales bacterium]
MTERTNTVQTKVKLTTGKGEIVIELNEQKAPDTVKNFLQYVNEGFYDGTIFHRVIPGFMAQGGGFTPDMKQKSTHTPVHNESSNGLRNDRGTIAMARTPDPDSATSQFFINVADNKFLNYPNNGGYTVFGKVVSGMEVVDAIVAAKRGRSGPHDDVPTEPIIIEKAQVITP